MNDCSGKKQIAFDQQTENNDKNDMKMARTIEINLRTVGHGEDIWSRMVTDLAVEVIFRQVD